MSLNVLFLGRIHSNVPGAREIMSKYYFINYSKTGWKHMGVGGGGHLSLVFWSIFCINQGGKFFLCITLIVFVWWMFITNMNSWSFELLLLSWTMAIPVFLDFHVLGRGDVLFTYDYWGGGGALYFECWRAPVST